MPSSLLFPLEQIKPSQMLSQYSEWIYFSLILVFFISVAGVSLRRHFDRPYVKPLIISVGLMLTFGVFRYRERMTEIFEGWGLLGTILLIVMAATIPYGLSRGFGVTAGKSFYVTYILFYIVSWVQFPQLYHALSDHNLGLVNLGFLVLFIVAIFKVVRPKGASSILGRSPDLGRNEPVRSEIVRDMEVEDNERMAVRKQAERMTKIEIRSVEDIAEALAEIQRIIETHRNNLPEEERERIGNILGKVSRDERIFKTEVQRIQKLLRGMEVLDAKQLKELKERMTKSEDKEKQILRVEIEGEEEKIRIEKQVMELGQNLEQYLGSFNKLLMAAVEQIKASPYPYDAKAYLAKARVVLKDILQLLQETRELKEKLVGLTKAEKKLLKKETKTV